MKAPENIYFKGGQEYDCQLILLEKEPIGERNKTLIKQFRDNRLIAGTGKSRVAKIILELRKVCRLLDKDLDLVNKTDLERIISTIQTNEQYSEHTKKDYKRVIKQFYRWFEDDDPRLQNGNEESRREAQRVYQYLRKHVSTGVKPSPVDPGSIITDEEISRAIEKGCRSDMERAFIKLLHETGCRIGEILNIRLKDIQKKDTCWIIRVDGKTGERPRPVLDSIPYLLRWLDFHPDKNNPEAYLWTSITGKFKGKRILYWGARRLINRVFERAGIHNKKINPHFFRHSRATLDAPKYADSIQCQIMGWTQGSRQVARYRHMAGKQAEDAFLKARGVKKLDEQEHSPQPIKCVCSRLNEPEAKFCSACGKALSLEIAQKEQEHLNLAFELMKKTFSDPVLLKQFEDWKNKQ